MKIYDVDILIIGSGLAGIRAAIEAKENGSNVLIVNKAPIGKACNTVMAKTIVSFLAKNETGEKFAEDIKRVGVNVNNKKHVDFFVDNVKAELQFVLDCGVEFSKDENDQLNYLSIPGHSEDRILRQKNRSGNDFFKPIINRARKLDIPMMDGVEIVSILTDDNKVYGAVGFDKFGEKMLIYAKSVILATGGFGSLYTNNDNAVNTVGIGCGMALDLGLALADMEFVQFYPTGIRKNGICRASISYENMVAKGGAVVRNRLGQDIRQLHGLQSILDVTRDRLSRAIGYEIYNGNGTGKDKKSLIFDLSNIDREEYRYCMPKSVTDDIDEVEIAPMAHFTMGGVVTDETGKTGIDGFWIIGELMSGLHGANRIAGVALAECLVVGHAAGRQSSEYALTAQSLKKPYTWDDTMYESIEFRNDIKLIYCRLKDIMNDYVGVVREAKGLEKAIAYIEELKMKQIMIIESEKSVEAIQLGRVLNVAQSVAIAALCRKETRGAHYRTDYECEDKNFQGNFIIRKIDDKIVTQFELNSLS